MHSLVCGGPGQKPQRPVFSLSGSSYFSDMPYSSCVCSYCGKAFSNKSALSQHESRHGKNAPYHCCGKLFYSHANMNRHRCNVHGVEKSFHCDTCNKSFPTNADLQRHKRRKEQKWEHTCDTCGQKFPSKDKLQDHMDGHTDKKRHVCPTCGRTFRYQSNLSRHKKGHWFVTMV